jgi:hypothetical protein
MTRPRIRKAVASVLEPEVKEAILGSPEKL